MFSACLHEKRAELSSKKKPLLGHAITFQSNVKYISFVFISVQIQSLSHSVRLVTFPHFHSWKPNEQRANVYWRAGDRGSIHFCIALFEF